MSESNERSDHKIKAAQGATEASTSTVTSASTGASADAPPTSTRKTETVSANESGTVKKRVRARSGDDDKPSVPAPPTEAVAPKPAAATTAPAKAEKAAVAEGKAAGGKAAGDNPVGVNTVAEATKPAPKPQRPLGPAAALAAKAAKLRAEGKWVDPPAPSATAAKEGADDADTSKRRVRRRRSIATKQGAPGQAGPGQAGPGQGQPGGQGGQAARNDGGPRAAGGRNRPPRQRNRRPEGEQGRPARPGEGGRTGPDRRPGGGRGERGGGTAMDRLLATPRRTIYRQDMGGDAPPPPPPDEASAAEVTSKPAQDDKITLILHPAPKAAPQRRTKQENRPKTAKEALRAKHQRHGKDRPSRSSSDSRPSQPAKLDSSWLSATSDSATGAAQAAGRAGEALVKAWLEQPNVDALVAVASADGGVAGAVRKAARRALNVLKARGVDVPEPQVADAVETSAETGFTTIATFVPPDASGVSFFSITRHQPGSRFEVADAVIRPPLGIVQANAGRLAGKQIRAWRNRVQEHFGASPVEVPLSWARHRIAAARLLNDASGQLVPLGYDRCLELFSPVPEQEPNHPLADIEGKLDSAAIDKAKLNSDRLHNEPEFRGWMPDGAALQELLAKVGQRLGADGINEPEKVDEALREEITAATDRFFSPERRADLCERMRDSAISVRARAGDDVAHHVLAVSRAIKEAGLITSPPSEVPFLVAYFQKGVAIMLQQQNGMLRIPVPQGAQQQAAAAEPEQADAS